MQNFDTLIQPDLFYWEQLQQQLDARNIVDRDFIESLQKLAIGSQYAITQLARYPHILESLQQLEHFELTPEHLQDCLAQISDEAEIKRQLRLFRHQKLVEIIFLDICRNEPVKDTLQHLTDLAELLIGQAQIKAEKILSKKHGQPVDANGEPMQLNIIGMGKLGGGELNFSSDIDLICTFSDEGQLKGFGQLSHTQFFTHVVKLFKNFLHETTADGFVYRVDLRLRPWGDAGPVVISHHSFEHYYQLHGREWEQYAMVKARVLTGSDNDKQYLYSILRPFVYRRYHDYRVFDGLAQMKHKIDQQARRRKERHNIKTGQGGIREIEFYVQAFQILKGGRNHLLQTQSLYRAVDVLLEQEITDRPTLKKMLEAYNFLRLLENRIQMMADQQTHDIPDKQNLLDRISLLTGYESWVELKPQLDQYQQSVSATFASLFTPDEADRQSKPVTQALDEMDEDHHFDTISELAFDVPAQIHQRLQEFYQSKALIYMSKKAKQRFRSFFPELLKLVASHENQQQLLDRMLALLSSISGRSVYFELLYQNIPLLEKLVHLFNSSNWIATEVTHHPILLESLLYPAHLSDRFDQQYIKQALSVQLNNVSGDEELELDVLRQFKREHTITIATAEMAEEISSAEVSQYLSELAEILMQAVYQLSMNALIHIHGNPSCMIDEQIFTPGMAIIGYGKLGGRELHYESDLDIIFLHNSAGDKQQTTGSRVIDNATFFARVAQKIISKVTMLTAAGKMYEIDTRLRPDGASGMLVSSMAAFQQYQAEKAWIWEHQAIVRARFIAGDPTIEPTFNDSRLSVLKRDQDPAELAIAIQDMRDKMYQAKNPPEGEYVNLKHSRGCMVDIEFMVQYLVLLHTNKFASLSETTDNTGLISELHRLGLVDAQFLKLGEAYQTFHRWLHTRVLQNQSAEIESQLIQIEIDLVKTCWKNIFTE